MYKHILVPTDGSALSDKAVEAAIRLAKLLGARITAFHAVEPYPLQGAYAAEASGVLRAQAANGLHDPKLVELFQRLWKSGALPDAPSRPAGFAGPPEAQAVADT